MQLKIQRSQRQSGVVSKAVMFCVDARVFLSAEEQANVTHYKLGNQIIYSSEAAKQHAASFEAHQKVAEITRSYMHLAKGFLHAVKSRLALKITIDSLQRGQHIECKDLDEVIDAEEALKQACQNLKGYLETAATFDGGAVVIDYSKDEPEIVSQPVLLAAPIAPAPIVEPMTTDFVASPAPEPAVGIPNFGGSTSSPQPNPLQPALDFWNHLTHEQRKWAMIIGGVVVLIVLYEIL
jgi:hypothetical protein